MRRSGPIVSLSVFNGGKELVSRALSAAGLSLGYCSITGAITSWTTLIHLAADEGGLETSLCLSVDRFFNQFVPAVVLSTALFHLGLYRRLESFSKELYESGHFFSYWY